MTSRKTKITTAATLALLTTFAGCSQSESSTSSVESRATVKPSAQTFSPLGDLSFADVARVEGLNPDGSVNVRLLEEYLEDVGVSEAQRLALSDGIAEYAEYLAGLNRAVQCIKSTGIDARVLDAYEDLDTGVLRAGYAYASEAEGLSEGEILEISAQCEIGESAFIERIYIAQNEPSEEEQNDLLGEELRRLYDCLVDAGVPIGQARSDIDSEDVVTLTGIASSSGLPDATVCLDEFVGG